MSDSGSKKSGGTQVVQISATEGLDDFKNHPKSKEIDHLFGQVFKKAKKPSYQTVGALAQQSAPDELDLGDLMSDKDQELSLDDLGDLELNADGDSETPPPQDDGGLELSLDDDAGLDLSAPDELPPDVGMEDSGMDLELGGDVPTDEAESLDLGEDDSFSMDDTNETQEDDIPDLNLGADDDAAPDLDFGVTETGSDDGLSLGDDADLILSDDSAEDIPDLDLGGELGGDDLSDDARKKLEEIDAIMVSDSSQVGITMDLSGDDDANLSLGDDDDLGLSLGGDDEDVGLSLGEDDQDAAVSLEASEEADIDQSLVSDDLDLGSISFGGDEEEAAPVKEDKTKKKTKEAPAPSAQASASSYDGNLGRELKEVSQAYSGEMERMQATISNLRSDREELLAKIQKLEEDKILQARQNLTMRAELDEKKIELSIIRKKLNDEITELKDRLKLHEERKLILEEKNKIMMVELDKAAQKNKIDVKKVQMRERELEQKLELLKSDSELQIRNRDLKILELKRKIDAMEFDMESISMQEKRSVESRFELEDKLDKAIKTLRSAISVLEDETEKSSALEALKKNIDM
jgi:hypothetical protein